MWLCFILGKNFTTVEFCPAGHYCVEGLAYDCKAGDFCPIGTGDPYECPFGLLTCSADKTDTPNEGVLFIMLFLIFAIISGGYWMFSRYIIKKDATIRLEKVSRVVSVRRDTTAHGLAIEHDQHTLVRAVDNIQRSMAAREKTLTSGKWADMLDDETVERFSMACPVVLESGPAEGTRRKSLVGTTPLKRGSITANTGGNVGAVTVVRRQSNAPVKPPTSVAESDTSNHSVNSLQASMKNYDYDDVAMPLTLSFTHMYLNLKTTGETVLSDVCVSIKPFHVTAIMGPSGAGKTSLLSLLRGQAHYATVSGEITVNGHQVGSLELFRRRTAYVPQEDIVNDELSIEENILYSALLFNRRGYLHAAEVMPMVLRAEKLLDISHIRTSVVGNAARRGISGGQKKRVSIGMELMKEAELFFLDEPTSGLDSASSMLVVNALHFLASKGVTVATTIHQPRQEILNLMDNLLLLAPGGRVAYYGPIIDLHQHFSCLNFTCPVGTNIADYVMDTLCGFVLPDGEEDVWEVKDTIDYICDWWADNRYPDFRQSMTSRVSILREQSDIHDLLADASTTDPERMWRYGWATQAGKVLCACFNRQVKTNYRILDSILTTCALLLVFGIIVAFLSGPLALDGTSSGVSSFSAQVTSGALVFSLLVQAASLRLLSADQLLRDRELRAGVMVGPYYLGKILGNYCELCLYSFAFLVGYYPFLQARAPLVEYWYVFFLLHLAISGMVNCIVVAYPSSNKATFSVGCVVLLWSFGGMSPPLSQMQASMGGFATLVNTISPFKYSYEIEVINELSRYPEIWDIQELYNKLNYDPHDRGRCIVVLIIYFLISNLLAYICLEIVMTKPRLLKNLKEQAIIHAENLLRSSKMRESEFSLDNYNTNTAGGGGRHIPTVDEAVALPPDSYREPGYPILHNETSFRHKPRTVNWHKQAQKQQSTATTSTTNPMCTVSPATTPPGEISGSLTLQQQELQVEMPVVNTTTTAITAD